MHYSGACEELAAFSTRFGIPVAETIMGRSALVHEHRLNVASLGVMGGDAGNALAAEADVVVSIGTRLADMITGSWTVFRDPSVRFVSLNANRFDANKHMAHAVVGDARLSLQSLTERLGSWTAPRAWGDKTAAAKAAWDAVVDRRTAPTNQELPNYPQVIGAVQRQAQPADLIAHRRRRAARRAGTRTWKSGEAGRHLRLASSASRCMGYEIAGAYGQKIAHPDREIFAFVGDGGYLMLNSDIYSSVLTGNKIICIVCDNGGFAVINRLQVGKGGAEFNNLFESSKRQGEVPRIDFAMHARSMGADAENVVSIADLERALQRARASERTYVIAIRTHAYEWMEGGSWWDVGMPAVASRPGIDTARETQERERVHQRQGV